MQNYQSGGEAGDAITAQAALASMPLLEEQENVQEDTMAKFFVVDGMRGFVGCATLAQIEDNYPTIRWLAAEPLRLVSDFFRHQKGLTRGWEVLVRTEPQLLALVEGVETPRCCKFIGDDIRGVFHHFVADTGIGMTHIGSSDDREGLLMEARARVGCGRNHIAIIEKKSDDHGEWYVATLLTAGGHLLSQEEVDFRREKGEVVSQPSPEVLPFAPPAPPAQENDDEEI